LNVTRYKFKIEKLLNGLLNLSLDYKNIIMPFDEFVWGCIAAASLAVSITMFMIDWGAIKKVSSLIVYVSKVH